MAIIAAEEDGRELIFTPQNQLDAVRHLVTTPFGFEGASLHMYRQDTPLMQPTDPTPEADAFMAVMHLRPFEAHREWRNGEEIFVRSAPAGSFRLYDLRDRHVADVPFPFHTVHVLLPNSSFRRRENGVGSNSIKWKWEPNGVIGNPVLNHLVLALLPALETSNYRDKLFCEHVLNAVTLHVSQTYGDVSQADGKWQRKLNPWQERGAKELLINRMTGDISLEEVASSCGLSADTFSRMFCRTTGVPPYRWLSAQRIERAKELLANTKHGLAEVAIACGFADQSHFTRAFSRAVRISPGEWRRQATL
jgi:AraC family transcriptional regulator